MRSTLVFFLIGLFGLSCSAVCVKASHANIRSGPGTHYKKTWEVYQYMPFKKLRTKGLWTRIKDVDGDRHWIYSPLLTSSYRCAVVKAQKANLRTGPGTHYKRPWQFKQAIHYTSFRLLKTHGNWCKVKDVYGDSYWIHKSLVWIH